MEVNKLKSQLGNIDIYLLDQILKGKIIKTDIILDAGCGSGRNLVYFNKNNYDTIGIDSYKEKILNLQSQNIGTFVHADLRKIPFNNARFDYIICNAVLHFAKNTKDFLKMFSELYRVLKPNGTLFIRMTSIYGMEKLAIKLSDATYKLPDGTKRFLWTDTLHKTIFSTHSVSFIEPIKTVNVNNLRCMTTLILKKNE